MTIFKSLLIGVVLAVVSNGAAIAGAPDPIAGTWTLNVAKSTFKPGPAPKAQTREYRETADGLNLTVTTTAASGKTSTSTLAIHYDGKPYPATGEADYDSVAVTRVSATEAHAKQFKAGKEVTDSVRTISKDGKTLTFKQTGTHADGSKFDNVAVFDKQ